MRIVLKKELMEEMKDHAVRTYPMECCGFVFGTETTDERQVSEIQSVINSKQGDQRRRFEIDPMDYLKAERYALAHDITLLGIYHSHPDHPAIPSEHDLKQAVPFFSYLILSTGKEKVNKVTSWQLEDQKFEEEEIVIKQFENLK
jgi:proteasome lid subunit RPN8/RPN11